MGLDSKLHSHPSSLTSLRWFERVSRGKCEGREMDVAPWCYLWRDGVWISGRYRAPYSATNILIYSIYSDSLTHKFEALSSPVDEWVWTLETPLKAPLATAHPSYPFSTKLFFFFRICSIVLLCFISWRAAALRSVSPSFKLRHHSWLLLGAFHICTPMTPIPLIIQNNNIAHWLNNAQCALHIADHSCLKTLQMHSAHKLNSAHMTLNIVQDFAGKLLNEQWSPLCSAKYPLPRPCFFRSMNTSQHILEHVKACWSI